MNVNCLPFDTARPRVRPDRRIGGSTDLGLGEAPYSLLPAELTFGALDMSIIAAHKPRRVPSTVSRQAEYRLATGDDAKISLVAVCCSNDSVRSRLSSCKFPEQSHVLDSDDRLVGEGFQESDLFIGEWPNLVRRI